MILIVKKGNENLVLTKKPRKKKNTTLQILWIRQDSTFKSKKNLKSVNLIQNAISKTLASCES